MNARFHPRRITAWAAGAALAANLAASLVGTAAPSAQTTFQVTIGTPGTEDRAPWADRTCDGGYIVAANHGDGLLIQGYVLKLKANGDIEWEQLLTTPAPTGLLLQKVKQVSDGGFIVLGQNYDTGLNKCTYLCKLDFYGTVQWSHAYSGTGNGDNAQGRPGIDETPDGGFIVASRVQGTGNAQEAPLLIRTDRDGALLWSKYYTDSRYTLNTFGRFNGVKVTPDGNFIACGNTCLGVSGSRQTLLVKTDPNGAILWSKTYDQPGYDVAFGLDIAANGDFLVVGTKQPTEEAYAFVMRTDPAGNLVWLRHYPGFGQHFGSIHELPAGDIILSGINSASPVNDWDASLLKLDSAGAVKWCKAYGYAPGLVDLGYCVVPAPDGGFLLAAETRTAVVNQNHYYDLYFIKTDDAGANGCNERDVAVLSADVLPPIQNVSFNLFPLTFESPLITLVDPPNGLETVLCRKVAPPPCAPPPPDMVAWWTLDEPSGNSAADIAGTVNNAGAHINSPTPVPGVVAGALHFGGALKQYVEVPHQSEVDLGLGDFSIDAWIHLDAFITLDAPIVSKWDGSGGYYFLVRDGHLSLVMSGPGGSWVFYIPTAGTLPINTDLHVAVTVSRNQTAGIQFYVNGLPHGLPLDPTAQSGVDLNNPEPLRIGASRFEYNDPLNTEWFYFEGMIDEVELFTRALGPCEIAQIYNAGHSGKCKAQLPPCVQPPIQLTAWWPFDETSGTTAGEIIYANNGAHLNGPTPAAGMVAGALSFDGTDDYVSAPDHPALNFPAGKFSVDFWIYPNPGETTGTIVRKGIPGSGITLNSAGYHLFYSSGHILAAFSDGSTGFQTDLSPNLTHHALPGQWTFVVVTVDLPAHAAHLYVNGVLAQTTGIGVNFIDTSNTEPLIIGGYELNVLPGASFNGLLDELEFFNRVLSQSDIDALFQAGQSGKCKAQAPVACLLGIEWTLSALLYDLDAATGLAVNPRNTGLDMPIGLEVAPNGTVFTITSAGLSANANSLFTLDRVTGTPTLVALITVPPELSEGDMAICPPAGPFPGWIYYTERNNLYRMDANGAGQVFIGSVPPGGQERKLSGIAFNDAGQLYAVDTSGNTSEVFEVNPATGGILGTPRQVSTPIGRLAGFDFDPSSGVFYLTDSNNGGDNRLFTLDVITGAATPKPNLTGTLIGFSGLAVAPCQCVPDLWVKDTMAPDLPEDFGAEPNTASTVLFVSRDIWVRVAQDTLTGTSANPGPDTTSAADRYYAQEHQHENPTYVNSTTANYVYVKVRNRGCAASTGGERLRVYWADANTGLPWPGSGVWTEIDCVTGGAIDPCPLPVIAPGQDFVVELPWIPPDPAVFGGNHHFCLVARIETLPLAPFGMAYAEGPTLWLNVKNNNNIAWKNLTVITGGGGGGHVIVQNTLSHGEVIALHFGVPGDGLSKDFLSHGTIKIDLGTALMEKWRQGGQPAIGFVVVGNTTQIQITDPTNAVLAGLTFGADEKQMMTVEMQLNPDDTSPAGTIYNWDIVQMAPLTIDAEPSPIGGVRYSFIVPGSSTPPAIVCADPQIIQCPGIPNFPPPLVSDDCDPNPILTYSDVTTPGTCPQLYSVTRTWTVTDHCGNHASCSQTIAVMDTIKPVITQCPTNRTLSPDLSAGTAVIPDLTGEVAASDNCSTVTIVQTPATGTFGPGTHPLVFTAYDACGNFDRCTNFVTIIFQITMDCPDDITVDCTSPAGAVVNYVAPIPTSTCSGAVSVNCVENPPLANAYEFPIGVTTVACTATDTCGNTLTCTFTVTVRASSSSVSLAEEWARSGGLDAHQTGNSIAVDAAGNSYVAGFFTAAATFTSTLLSAGGQDALLVKYDTAGNVLWAVKAGGLGDDAALGVAVDAQGDVLVTGYFHGTATFSVLPPIAITVASGIGGTDSDVFLAKYDPQGICLWAVANGGPGNDRGTGVATDGSGNVYATGTFESSAIFAGAAGSPLSSSAGNDSFLAKHAPSGAPLWVDASSTVAGSYASSRGVAVDPLSGAAWIVGLFSGDSQFGATTLSANPGSAFAFVAHHGPNPGWIWAKSTLCGSVCGNVDGRAIGVDASGNCFFTAYYNGDVQLGSLSVSAATPHYDCLVASLDSQGNPRWLINGLPSSTTADQEPRGLAVDYAGNVFVTGFLNGLDRSAAGGEHVWLRKYDNAIGTVLWQGTGLGTSGSQFNTGWGVDVDLAGCAYVAGTFIDENLVFASLPPLSTLFGEREIFLAKYCPTCCAEIPHGLVSWYPMDNTPDDYYGLNNPNLPLNSFVTFVPGKVQEGANFIKGGKIEIPDSTTLANPQFTLDAWVYPEADLISWPLPGRAIIVKGSGVGTDTVGLYYAPPPDGRFRLTLGNQAAAIVSANTFPLNQYHFVAATFNGTTLNLYVDGALEGFANPGAPPVYNSTEWMIGAGSPQDQSQARERYWIGIIDEVEIFDRPLVSSEIQGLFEMGVGGKCKGPCWPRPHMTIQLGSPSTLVITWTGSGQLQSAPSVTGPWTTLFGATSPYTITLPVPGLGQQFFRVICN